MSETKVFVVTADASMGDSVQEVVESAGLIAEVLPSLRAFLAVVEPGGPGCLVLDAQIADLEDEDRQARLVAAFTRTPGILITDRGDVPMAIRAIKAGAMDVVQKPYRVHSLLDSIKKALATDTAIRR